MIIADVLLINSRGIIWYASVTHKCLLIREKRFLHKNM